VASPTPTSAAGGPHFVASGAGPLAELSSIRGLTQLAARQPTMPCKLSKVADRVGLCAQAELGAGSSQSQHRQGSMGTVMTVWDLCIGALSCWAPSRPRGTPWPHDKSLLAACCPAAAQCCQGALQDWALVSGDVCQSTPLRTSASWVRGTGEWHLPCVHSTTAYTDTGMCAITSNPAAASSGDQPLLQLPVATATLVTRTTHHRVRGRLTGRCSINKW
jgi:hypothetical protein